MGPYPLLLCYWLLFDSRKKKFPILYPLLNMPGSNGQFQPLIITEMALIPVIGTQTKQKAMSVGK